MDTLTPSRFEVIADDVIVERDVMVTMRDGIKLATDVYRPAKDGKVIEGRLPAIMERTPYGKAERSRSEIEVGMTEPMKRHEVASYFVRAGYAVIYQDCRGRYNSEGEFSKYISEAADGYDTARWLVEQAWSNGQFGTMGLSYAAHTQAALACLNPPGLACMVMDSGGFSNAYQCGIRQGGAFELKQATWAYNQAIGEGNEVARAAIEAEDIRAWFNVMPWSEGASPVRWMPEYENYLLDQWRSGTFDESWRRVGLYMEGFYETFPEVPIALMSSWYDAYVKSTLDNYRGLSGKNSRPLRLIMGPWLHGNRNTTLAGDTSFGPTAPLGGNVVESWLSFRRNWFDHWLKGKDNAVAQEPVVRAFVMGGGSGMRNPDGRLDHGGGWIEASDWPLPGTEFRNYYIHENGSLSTEKPKASAAPFTYDFDPKNPVPTIGGSLTSGQPIFEGGGFDQREGEKFYGSKHPGLPLSARADVLSFETEPLAEDVAVVGPITVELYVSSDAPDTDFTAKLVDVYPPSKDYPTGYALNITDGIIRCRYRNSFEKPEPIVKGEVFKVTIEPFATANLFAKGHRIRVDISSSNFPKYDINPNSYAPEGRGRTSQVARNTVFCDGTRASAIRLPIVGGAAMVGLKPIAK
ncbi:CocE/NonD family hydrolase [Neorhizobium galegae]|uniref:Hydrolase CocE/NonD family protein n=1 Tax=Neorhizobium galegae bv. orientalis str. HAMBI 540 TaxID=1028800 RepID=A0A068SYS1_NEOGA|nr:CocE/NonD family hydrolase [Neorhizobium galegae]MCQ1851629.1 CocE/NonD family hydrolase [Neorhizobium galegae]CDN50290.1 Hydrolase CocE/NonD family protein [Neorhizobium galegae bv. orientalis str. HAMBI 540]